MKNLNCNKFQISIQFDNDDFKVKEFRKVAECEDDEYNAFVSHHSSKSKSKKEHAHLELMFADDINEMQVIFHNSKLGDEGELETSDITLEDCVNDISQYFNRKQVNAITSAVFRFDKNFETTLKLRFPLLVDSEVLKNAVIAGHDIVFNNDGKTGRFLVTTDREGLISVVYNSSANLELKSFNLYNEIKEALLYIEPLVKRREVNNEKNSD